jgi:hypothetical protein
VSAYERQSERAGRLVSKTEAEKGPRIVPSAITSGCFADSPNACISEASMLDDAKLAKDKEMTRRVFRLRHASKMTMAIIISLLLPYTYTLYCFN